MDVVCKIDALFARRGGAGNPAGGVTALAHALQCAQLAEWAHADNTLVAAALLHDLGELVDGAADEGLHDDQHELRALGLLAVGGFGSTVLEPIRLHVQAERCQMGRMNVVERLVFLATPFAPQAMQLARWDALARQPGRVVPPLGHYLNLLDDVLRAKCRPQRPMLAAS